MANNTVPRFFALHSVINNKYLRYLHEEGKTNKYVQFSGDEIANPYVKFEAVKAKTGKGLVHIRCCYNNKYWVKSSTGNYIAASADELEEDQSKWTCTLFEPLFIDAKTLRFRHVQLGSYACLWRTDPPFTNCVYFAGATIDNAKCDIYTIIDWESLMILPKHIAFKGDNGLYLSARTLSGNPYHLFAASDIGDTSVGFEVFTTSDGNIRIKSNFFNKFWRPRGPTKWIWADADDTTADTVFLPIKVDNNIIALRNMVNNNFCKRLTDSSVTSGITANITVITKEARMEVEELVLSRKFYYVDFRLMDARVYDQNVVTMAYGSADNKTQETKTVEVKLSYTDTKTSTWNSSVSLKLFGGNSTIQSKIPEIGNDGKVQASDEFTGIYQWGKTESSTNIVGTGYHVALPPMTTMRVTLLATKGSCDVPFSYAQRDILYTGENIVYYMDDGVYTGVNCFNFKFEVKQESLA